MRIEKLTDEPPTRKNPGTRLDGKTWLKFSLSVWNDIRRTPEELKIGHPAMFPTMLCDRLVQVFSAEGDLVFDPFAGSGSTLLAARSRNRASLGIELSPEFVDLFHRRLEQTDIFDSGGIAPEMVLGDALQLDRILNGRTVDLTVTSPPYWDILNQRRSADGKDIRNYGSDAGDLGNIRDYDAFLDALGQVFGKVYDATRLGGYCCVVVMDLRKGNKFFPFHMDIVNRLTEIGFEFDDTIIWDRRQEYNSLRPLGYPSVFRVNKIHEFILIFQKRGDEEGARAKTRSRRQRVSTK